MDIQSQNTKKRAVAPNRSMALLAALLTSTSSLFIRSSAMPPLTLAFFRLFFASLILLVWVAIKGFKGFKAVKKTDFLWCALSGLALALHFGTWIASVPMTTVAASTVLVALSPIFVALFGALFFKEKPGLWFYICIFAAILGSILIAFGSKTDGFGSLLGNLLALSGAVFVAIYLMIGQRVRQNIDNLTYVFIVYSFAALFLLPAAIFMSAEGLGPFEPKEYLIALAVAVLCSVGGHTMYNWLLAHHGAQLISLSSLCEPLFASVMALIFLQEMPSALTLLGGIIILIGLALYIKKDAEKAP